MKAPSRPPAAARKPTDFDQHWEPGPLLRRCYQRSRSIYTEVLGRSAPTPRQFAIMIAAYQLEEPTQSRISARTGVDRNTIADIVPRLVKRGLMEKLPMPGDSRAWELRLTKRGRTLVEKLVPLAVEMEEQLLAPLPEELRPVFVQCLRLVAGVEAASSEGDLDLAAAP